MYLLKSGEVASIAHTSYLLCYSRKTVQRWLGQYQREGLQGLLAIRHEAGRPVAIPKWAQVKLKARLKQPQGLPSYGEIVIWLASECNIWVNYWGGYHWVRQRWKAELKASHPSHAKQDPEAIEQFSDHSYWTLRKAVHVAPDLYLCYRVEEESRFGLKPIFRRRITACGVPPVTAYHWQFEWV